MTEPAVDWEDVKEKRVALLAADDAARRAETEASEARVRCVEVRKIAAKAQAEFHKALWPEWPELAHAEDCRRHEGGTCGPSCA